MQFSTTTLLTLLTLATASPVPQTTTTGSENIAITDFVVRSVTTGPVAVSFNLSGTNATDLLCSSSDPGFPSDVIICGDSKYRFALYPGTATDYALRLYHELGAAFGYYGEGDVPTYCRAGGASADDFVCQQAADVNIVISAA